MKRITKITSGLLLIFTLVFSFAGCTDEAGNSSLTGESSVTASEKEEISSAAQSEQKESSSAASKSEQSTTSLNTSDEKEESKTSSRYKRPTTSTKSSSNKVSTSSAYVKDTSLYMMDYIFRNKIYADEYFNRGGIYNTLYKLQKGEDITIAYLGGSITEQKTWRTFTTKWFEDNFSGKVNEVEIGTSGTGADLAVCRIDEEILKHNPDLVFIEYAVNGGKAKDMEGMVLKTWRHDPTIDICFVYTTITNNYSTYAAGALPQYAEIYEEVAEYYNIPSVFFGKQAFDLYEKGKLILKGDKAEDNKILYTKDGTHITEEGGNLAAGAIARSVKNMLKSFNKDSYTITKHQYPAKTYSKNPWDKAMSVTDWSKLKFSGNWFNCPLVTRDKYENYDYYGGSFWQFRKLFDNMQGTKTAGSSVTIKFKGTDIGIMEAGGQYSGQLRVIVDGVEQTKKLVLFGSNYNDLRLKYCFIPSLPYSEHTVTFILDSEMPDKSALQNKYPNDKIYERNELYIGRILLNGELLDANK